MSSNLRRFGGWTLVSGSLLLMLSTLLHLVFLRTWWPSLLPVVGLEVGIDVLLLVGLYALSMALHARSRVLSLIALISGELAVVFALVLNIFGLAIVLSTASIPQSGEPPLWVIPFFLGQSLFQVIGFVLFGIAILRTRTFPALTGWLLLVSGLLVAVAFPFPDTIVASLSTLLAALSMLWIGFLLVRGTSSQEAETLRPEVSRSL